MNNRDYKTIVQRAMNPEPDHTYLWYGITTLSDMLHARQKGRDAQTLGTLWSTLFGAGCAKEVSLLSTPPAPGRGCGSYNHHCIGEEVVWRPALSYANPLGHRVPATLWGSRTAPGRPPWVFVTIVNWRGAVTWLLAPCGTVKEALRNNLPPVSLHCGRPLCLAS